MKESYQDRIEKAKQLIKDADYVLVGAGAGLSTSAGFDYTGKDFRDIFKEFIERYKITDMYSGGFYPYKTSEEKWAFWSKYVYYNRYQFGAKDTYKKLLKVVENKDYFVLTTNVDHQFQLAGFDKERLFYTQGDYGLFQCSVPCHNKTYDNREEILKMVSSVKDCKIPTELIPHCPICHKEMEMNLRADDTFVEDEGWHKHAKLYTDFIDKLKGKKVVLLETGVGYNTPGIIKYPFERMTYQNKNFTLIRINKDYPDVYTELEKKSVCFDEDVNKIINDLIG